MNRILGNLLLRRCMQSKNVYTTGEAAKICKVSLQTINRSFDNNELEGFRIPGSRFRRIPREALSEFAKSKELPAESMLATKPAVDILSSNKEQIALLKESVEDLNLEINDFGDCFNLGVSVFEVMQIARFAPRVLIFDIDSYSIDLVKIILEKVKESSEFKKTAFWAMTDPEQVINESLELLFDRVITKDMRVSNLSELFIPFSDIVPDIN